ncbi:MAG: 4-(cytidine 5'-diphospho)-2-C-methyl-D-erythritol kinase [Halomonas sp.]|nr:4-(cytidine 5'-diphospho)-2-C-methyl-D-erythritol kinase [Halomonas sp.]MDN6298380.1 4-(cytidine 5'-diphospho)-2-C-methyl-D-erythritol kinase [Halomonas sp.]MDN6315609.1 4-(cytidine 5'-diphospho)-2-C-methyl-D-erythritol kinase [Halomonas sp.]MDN6337003.1 4-(cytidine 5'-diphospho)-2-C-methyl-D-erythritol kinase [Halomonas sp.]
MSATLPNTLSTTRPTTLHLPAPAKLNRLLHITGRRADGYHELQTLFQFLDLSDDITLTPRTDGQLVLANTLDGVAEEANLALRAARLLKAQAPASVAPRCGADIALNKRLPMGGGLGGGSSNAATVLVGLNALWQLGLSLDELGALGLSLGADVPVFIHGHSAWAEGIGEKLTPVTLDTPWFVILHPGVSVSTPAVFGDPQLTRHTPPISMARALQGGASTWQNDCEAVVKAHYPPVAKALDFLSRFAPGRLTGTGACVFAAFENAEDARHVAQAASQYGSAWVAKGCNVSPLHDALGG